jgi:sugar O-acyltransferase (sialic acid O-acetyltransferase NeuD family)
LQGGGEHAKVVLDGLLSMGIEVLALFDPKYSGELFGVPQRGAYDESFAKEAKAIIAIGGNKLRKDVAAFTKHDLGKFIHTTAIVSDFANIGAGSMIMQGAIVQAQALIGKHVIVNTAASVDHDCLVGDYVHIAPGAVLCGRVKVGEGALIVAGAVILPGISIGKWATVGAGSVVTKDVNDWEVVLGNPARKVTMNKLELG